MINKLIALTITATLFSIGSYQYIDIQHRVHTKLVDTQTQYQDQLANAYQDRTPDIKNN